MPLVSSVVRMTESDTARPPLLVSNKSRICCSDNRAICAFLRLGHTKGSLGTNETYHDEIRIVFYCKQYVKTVESMRQNVCVRGD